MKKTKAIVVLIFLLLAAILVGVWLLLNSRNAGNGTENALNETVDASSQPAEEVNTSLSSQNAEDESVIESSMPKITIAEDIAVVNNTSEYDMKVTIYGDSNEAVFLNLEYYMDGESKLITINSQMIAEIDGIFTKRASESQESESFKIKTVYLNAKLGKVYILINGNSTAGYNETSLYMCRLDDGTVKKIFENTGKYADMKFNRDFSYLAYSYEDPPESSIMQEKTLFEVVDCSKDELGIKNSRTKDMKRIGTNVDSGIVFDFAFISWKNGNTIKLKQTAVLKADKEKFPVKEVLYNVKDNLFVNPDGSAVEIKSENIDIAALPAESESIKALKTFYSLLSSEKDYPQAMELLDDEFILKMLILSSFGVEKLVKSDIDVESATGFSDLLKSSSIEAILDEKVIGGIAVINYYQNMDAGSGTQVRMAMTGKLKKSGKVWKLISIEDADMTKPPFAE